MLYLSGSESVAQAVKLARVEVISAYPITPNVLVLEAIQNLIERGELQAESINAESELGAMNVCAGAQAAGCRTFTCTCAQGIALMKEVLWMASGMALPVVIADTSRAIGSPQTFDGDFSDSLSERDASFLQFYCESSQESLDAILLAYKIGEDPRVLLPSFVVLEGFRISHTYELVDVPEQESVDQFLPPYRPKHGFIDPDYPISQGCATFSDYMETKYQQYAAMQRAKEVIVEVHREFAQTFGRAYGNGLIEEYRLEDAELALVTMGTVAGIARDTVDDFRQRGIKVGMLKIRCFRPFPEEDLRRALSHVKKVLVLDRACSPGSRGGISYTEVCAALRRSPALVSNYLIGSRDLFQKDLEMMAEVALEEGEEFIRWYNIRFRPETLQISGYENYRQLVSGQQVMRKTVQEGEPILGKGNPFCPGCGGLTAVRLASQAFDKKTAVSMNCGCLGAMAIFPLTSWKVPYLMFTFSHAGGGMSGVEVGLKVKGIEMDLFLYGGDGGIFDIGLQTLSAALERGHRIVYFCYDNEAYMNTGIQRSGATPLFAKTKTTPSGKVERKKDIMKIIEAHGDVYTATASIAYPTDLIRKVKRAKECGKPAFIHALAPCPTGWESDAHLTVELARLAVETGLQVLYEQENGQRVINRQPQQRKPIEEYLSKQGRFAHLTKEQIAQVQAEVDRRFEELVASAVVKGG